MKGYRKLRGIILNYLKELPKNLTYHGYNHTMDVLNVCNQYIRRLHLTKEERSLLRIAALSHDIGFVKSYIDHEEVGAEMLELHMKELNIDPSYIAKLKKMIIATKPSNPALTKLEKIICDADLDYLGRSDFEPISKNLYKELKNLGLIKSHDEWMELQIKFFETHEFQTPFAKKYRAPVKAKWLEKLKNDY